MIYILLLYFVVQGAGGTSSWECVAFDGQLIKHGEKFVPGPDFCTVCECVEGKARLCQAVLCQPPQNCMSFRMGETCCDFMCLDPMLPTLPKRPNDANIPNPTTDLGLRMVASAVTAILSLALLLFLVHRLRQQRRIRAQQQYYEDPDSPVGPNVDSGHSNACCHNAAYCSGNDHVDFFLDGRTPPYSLWKPPSFYFPHGDAPPPYSEVVASSYRVSEANALPALGPLWVQLPGGKLSDSHGVIVGASSSGYSGTHSPPVRVSISRNGVTLRSDEVYEDVDRTSSELPPPYCPSSEPLNDLNRGIEVGAVGNQASGCSAVGCEVEEGSLACSCSADEACCSLCSQTDSACAGNNPGPQQEVAATHSPVRLRTREAQRRSQRASYRKSTMEEFQLRLSMDISDSSTSSEGPTRTFSSSSDDSTSMDITSEMR